MKLAVPRVSFRSHCFFYRRCLSGPSNRHLLGVVHTNYLRLSISTSPSSSSCNNSTDPSAQILTRTKLNFTPPPRSHHLSHPTADMGSQPEQKKRNGAVDLRPAEVAGDLGFTPVIQVSGPWTVDKVVEKIPGDAPVEGSESPVPFFHLLERLKTTKREGWRRFGIERGESIADHMYRMSMISMFAPPSLAPKLDLAKCMKMCLIHDMAELLVGDITPVDGVPKPEKSRREAETMDFLTKNLLRNVAGGTTGEDIRAIWQEYEDSKTLESHFVHDVDKMELLLQMVEYEKHGDGKLDLGEFAYVATRITLPEMKAWGQEVLKEREAFWGSKAHVHGEQGVDGGVEPERKGQQDDYYSRG